MPRLISRQQALDRIAQGQQPACLMCALLHCEAGEAGPVHVVFEDPRALLMLPRYVRRWRQMMVIPKAHVTSYREVEATTWAYANQLAHTAAKVVEHVQKPRLC